MVLTECVYVIVVCTAFFLVAVKLPFLAIPPTKATSCRDVEQTFPPFVQIRKCTVDMEMESSKASSCP